MSRQSTRMASTRWRCPKDQPPSQSKRLDSGSQTASRPAERAQVGTKWMAPDGDGAGQGQRQE